MTTDRQFSLPGADMSRRQLLDQTRANLTEAMEEIQRALSLPGARRGRIWALGMVDRLRVLAEAFDQHASISEGALEDLVEDAPQLDQVVVELESEHAELTLMLGEELCRLRREPSAPETAWIQEMKADLDATVRALLNHQEREACFVHDSQEIETGGGD